MPLQVGDSGTLCAPGSWAPPRGVSLSVGGYAVCFGGTIVLLWLARGGAWAEPFAIATGLAAAFAWCIRNWVVLPHLRRMARRCNAGRTAAAIGLLRWIPAALGVLFGLIATVFLIDSRDGLGWVGAGVAMAAWLLGLGWMAAWVVLLIVLARAVGRMERRVKGRRGPGLRPAALKVD